VDIAKVYFIIGYYLKLKRAMTIYILYKEGKADYSLLRSVREQRDFKVDPKE
jgi:hypothetical protein